VFWDVDIPFTLEEKGKATESCKRQDTGHQPGNPLICVLVRFYLQQTVKRILFENFGQESNASTNP